jgi:uncharacterized protein
LLASVPRITYNARVEFDWDPRKAASNVAKHGIDFLEGALVFDDPMRVERPDTRIHGEPRFQTIGIVNGRTLFVVYTVREGMCRIISVRRANRRERATYSVQTGDRP